MVQLKRGLKYLAFVVMYGVIWYLAVMTQVYLRISANRSYDPIYNVISFTAVPVVFGISLAIPHIIMEIKKQGAWRFDWVKNVFISLPTLMVTLLPVYYFYTPLGKVLPPVIFSIFNQAPAQICLMSGTVFGYSIINSFGKGDSIKCSDGCTGSLSDQRGD